MIHYKEAQTYANSWWFRRPNKLDLYRLYV